MTESEKWIMGCTIVVALCTIAAVVISVIALNKRSEVQISPQPLTVEIVKALHEQFADREEFKSLVKHVTERHGQIFSKIEKAERDAAQALRAEMTLINEDRRRTLEKLNERNERIMFALGKIAAAQGIDITPTE